MNPPALGETSSATNPGGFKNPYSLGNKLARLLWNVVWLLAFRPTPPRLFAGWRRMILRLFGAKLGKTYIHPSVQIWAPWKLDSGNDVAIDRDCNLYNAFGLVLGDRITVSQGCFMCTASHDHTIPEFPLIGGAIRVESDSWIAAQAFLFPGVTVGPGSVVGACAVVTRDVAPWTIVAGNPAKYVKERVVEPRGTNHMSDSSERFPLSVVILARNEARNIERCVRSVDWCAEVVVVDDNSTDETRALAEQAGARVVSHRFESFALQRNWALGNAGLKHDWVLMLDADEASTGSFRDEVRRQVSGAAEDVAAFRTCRKTIFGDRWLRRADEFPCWIMRIVRRGRARFEDAGHGEVPVPPVEGSLSTIHEPFLHYPVSHGVSDWFTRHVRYAEREAAQELAQETPVRWGELFSGDASQRRRAIRNLSRRLPMRPLWRFVYQYVLRGGFLEGKPGLMFSLMKAVYEAMIVVKVWELSLQKRGSSV